MRFLLIVSLFLALSSLATPVFAYPTWVDYRAMSDAKRAELDASMNALVSKIPTDGFKTSRIKFCAADSSIWETSPNASCATTKAAAVKQSWPPVITNEHLEMSWVAHSRFATAYCATNHEEKSCAAFN